MFTWVGGREKLIVRVNRVTLSLTLLLLACDYYILYLRPCMSAGMNNMVKLKFLCLVSKGYIKAPCCDLTEKLVALD